MAALALGERVPMPVKKLRENLRFYFAVLKFFVALLVTRVVFAIGINRRHEDDVLSVRRPDRAISAGRDRCDLMWFSYQHSASGVEIAHPNLRRIGRL